MKKHARFLFTIFWLSLIFLWTLGSLAGYDFWYYIAIGRYIVQSGHIPWSESFLGTTSVQSFGRYAEEAWLGNLVCYFFYSLGGPLGLVLLKSALLTATTWLVYRSSREVGLEPFWAASWATLGLWTIRARFEMRTYLFTDLFLALFILCLITIERDRDLGKKGLFLPLLFALWANIHQGILAGFIVLGCWLLAGRAPFKSRLLLTLSCFGASLLKPHSFDFLSFLRDHFANSSAMSGIVEWGPPSLSYLLDQLAIFFAVLVLLGGYGLIKRGRVKQLPPWSYLLTILAFSFAALNSIRSTSELLPIVCPLGAAYFYRLSPKQWLKSLAFVGLAYLYFSGFSMPGLKELKQTVGYPHALVDALPASHGQVFNSFEFGNYLVYRGVPPFIHGMASLYREQLVLDFNDVLNPTPRRWQIVNRYGVDTMLLHHPTVEDATEDLVETLSKEPDWKLELWDDDGLMFVKGKREAGLTQVYPWRRPSWTDPEKAKDELEKLLKRRPSALGEYMLSLIFMDQMMLKEATDHALKAIAIRPGYYGGWSQLALCYKEQRNIEGAIFAAQKAVNLAPQKAGARFNLAILLYAYSRQYSGFMASYYSLLSWYQVRVSLYYEPSFSPAIKFLRTTF